MMRSDSRSSALLTHIISQTKSNLDFLVSQNYLVASDAAGILSKLTTLEADPESSTSPMLPIAERTQQLSLIDRDIGMPERAQSPPKAVIPARRVPLPPRSPSARVQQAKALWDYNGPDPNDLSFRAGDIIEIVSETNVDWWTGKLHGQQGLFPSNYVERIETRMPASPGRAPKPVPAPMGRPGYGPPSGYGSPSSFSPGPPPWQNAPPPGPPAWQQGPPMGPPQPYGYEKQPMYAPAPMPMQAPPVQQAPPPQPEKTSRFGGLGNTMATAAAGGVGFGAGSAVGAGIIDSIF
ncbi:hypothetical protein M0805_006315 [Coniferiporia weirii]|nr:hypothetical protein M0805_006315 [Coniferiporia weirii]